MAGSPTDRFCPGHENQDVDLNSEQPSPRTPAIFAPEAQNGPASRQQSSTSDLVPRKPDQHRLSKVREVYMRNLKIQEDLEQQRQQVADKETTRKTSRSDADSRKQTMKRLAE